MVRALLSFGLGRFHNTVLHNWKLIFLTIGLLNFVCGGVFLAFMPDSPASARFLTHRQRVVAVRRAAGNMIGVRTRQIKLGQAVENLYDIKILCCAGIGIACGVVNGGVSNFASSLIKGLRLDSVESTPPCFN